MEQRERYDPEDIENLLNERGFDELLPEERAYVLRHISGRAEYEQMRALLEHVRHNEQDRSPIEADPAVRDRVMAAFRQGQEPQWRIWLNGVMLWLKPSDTGSLWRPALAFASLAVLVVLGILVVQLSRTTTGDGLAELRQERAANKTSKEQDAQPAAEAGAAEQEQLMVPDDITESEQQVEDMEERTERSVAANAPGLQLEQERAVNEELAEAKTIELRAAAESTISLAEHSDDMVLSAPTAPATIDSRIITESEMARNFSLSNASGKVSAPATRKRESNVADNRTRSVAQDKELTALLAAGW
ncbi:MAG: hypothetical protein KF905_08000 [Flavobacteriales bacterium]|nr:hypothetical protein [Flavobacteriales bacterium]